MSSSTRATPPPPSRVYTGLPISFTCSKGPQGPLAPHHHPAPLHTFAGDVTVALSACGCLASLQAWSPSSTCTYEDLLCMSKHQVPDIPPYVGTLVLPLLLGKVCPSSVAPPPSSRGPQLTRKRHGAYAEQIHPPMVPERCCCSRFPPPSIPALE